MSNQGLEVTKRDDGYGVTFFAMASPSEVLIDCNDQQLAAAVGQLVADEVWRIEHKYSRYLKESLCSQINASNGHPVPIDNETFLLLSFADQCFELSGGLFDLTSGVLRKIWHFDGGSNIPSQNEIDDVLPLIGWPLLIISEREIVVPAKMEIDFGGIGKEYAVDRAIMLARKYTDVGVLVNLGGDLGVTASRKGNQPWLVGIEHPGFVNQKTMIVKLYQGALATSGDAKRYLQVGDQRYSHILNPTTGWSLSNAARSITVAANQCVQAGMLATLSMLQGTEAEKFLTQQSIKHWVIR